MAAEDAIPEVLALLGISSADGVAARPAGGPSPKRAEAGESDWVVADWRELTLCRAGSGQAEWIELRGAGPVFRVTRTKARLISDLEGVVEAWAMGVPPPATKSGCSFKVIGGAQARIEIRHKDWRPIRMSQRHAQGLVQFRDYIRRFSEDAA